MGLSRDFEELEQEIRHLKREIDDLSHKRYSAAASKDKGKLWNARLDLAETTLKNCSAIADYVRKISESTANEIEEKTKMAAQRLEDLKRRKDLVTLHAWYKEELAPLLNKVEQEGNLVTEMRKKKGLSVR